MDRGDRRKSGDSAKTSVRALLVNAFKPGEEILLPSLFAGRREQIIQVVDALHTDGACPIIYGDRGLGKSSLAAQLQRISLGDLELLDDIGIAERGFGEHDAFVSFHVNCSDATPDTASVLQRAINEAENMVITWESQIQSERLRSRTKRTKFAAKIFERETVKTFESETSKARYTHLDLEERVIELARILMHTTGRRVMFILDELDRVRDTDGLASFVKSASSSELRFALVGIGQNVSSLIQDHASLERVSIPVEVPQMSGADLRQIVTNATEQLLLDGIDVTFTDEARKLLSSTASGFPWFVHVIGQRALLFASDQGEDTITHSHVTRAQSEITTMRLAQRFEDLYQMAVRDSSQREIVLRCFAEWDDQNIPTSEVYQSARTLGVGNPSAYKGHLGRDAYGRVLVAPPFQDRGLVRFSNEMFKVFVRIRPSLFHGVSEQVRIVCRTA